MSVADIRASVMSMIVNGDREGALTVLNEWGVEHGYERILAEVVEPVLKKVGEGLTERSDFSLAQAYLAAKVTGSILEMIAVRRARSGQIAATKGPVVLGNIEDDCHALGRRLVGTFLRADRWEVHDLGNDVLPEEFVDKAVEVDSRVIGASAMMYSTAENISRLRAEIDRRGLGSRIKLAVGGAVFVLRPDLVEEVGGDGTTLNATGAPALFDKLHRQSCEEDGE